MELFHDLEASGDYILDLHHVLLSRACRRMRNASAVRGGCNMTEFRYTVFMSVDDRSLGSSARLKKQISTQLN